jgi:farnesyl-diphosphate farnesyltransferase
MNDTATVEAWSGKDRGDENFPVGSVLISRSLRPHVHAYYAFARNADDIADSAVLAPGDKIARLDVMEDVLLGRREDGSPSARRLRESLARTTVPTAHATDLLIAFRQDATKRRYATMDELYEYCRYSAAPVGRFLVDLHGEDRACYAPSDALCISLQILNHLQDCAKDLDQLDRSYLPLAMLDEAGATIEDLRGKRETPALRRVFAALLDHTDALNRTASDLPKRTRNRRFRLECAVIGALACRLARRLRRQDPLAMRVKLTKGDAASSLLSALRYLP